MVPRCEAKSRSDIETDEKISIKKIKKLPDQVYMRFD